MRAVAEGSRMTRRHRSAWPRAIRPPATARDDAGVGRRERMCAERGATRVARASWRIRMDASPRRAAWRGRAASARVAPGVDLVARELATERARVGEERDVRIGPAPEREERAR